MPKSVKNAPGEMIINNLIDVQFRCQQKELG